MPYATMEVNKQPENNPASRKRKRVASKQKIPATSKPKEVNWDRYGILLAVAGTIITSIFSLVQWHQGQTAINQTQAELIETRKQNKLAYDQLVLAQQQFKYSQHQDAIKDFQDSIDHRQQSDRFNANLRLLSAQTDALIRNSDYSIESKAADLRVSLKEDTFHLTRLTNYSDYLERSRLDSSFRLINSWISPPFLEEFQTTLDITLQNFGERSTIVHNSAVCIIKSDIDSFMDREFSSKAIEKNYIGHYQKGQVKELVKDPLLFNLKSLKSSENSFGHYLLKKYKLTFEDVLEKKKDIFNGDLFIIFICLNVQDQYTKQIKSEYFLFELYRSDYRDLHTITPIILSDYHNFIELVK